MKRILWMLLMNLCYLPVYLVKLFRMSSDTERYSIEERFEFLTVETIAFNHVVGMRGQLVKLSDKISAIHESLL